jgi:hypothetical protein
MSDALEVVALVVAIVRDVAISTVFVCTGLAMYRYFSKKTPTNMVSNAVGWQAQKALAQSYPQLEKHAESFVQSLQAFANKPLDPTCKPERRKQTFGGLPVNNTQQDLVDLFDPKGKTLGNTQDSGLFTSRPSLFPSLFPVSTSSDASNPTDQVDTFGAPTRDSEWFWNEVHPKAK